MTTLSLPPQEAPRHFRFGVEGMSCASCVGRVEAALAWLPGVLDATVNLATETADVRTDGSVSANAVAEAVEAAGYSVATQELTLAIEGMTCASCAGRVERALDAVPGVRRSAVNLATELARVSIVAGTPIEALIAAV